MKPTRLNSGKDKYQIWAASLSLASVVIVKRHKALWFAGAKLRLPRTRTATSHS